MKIGRKLLVVIAMFILVLSCSTNCSAAAKISNKTLSLTVGQKKTLKVTGNYNPVVWISSKPSVASISSKGKVTAKKVGNATITAVFGTKKLTCKVTVKSNIIPAQPNDEFVFKSSSYNVVLKEGESSTVTITYNKNGSVYRTNQDESIVKSSFGKFINDDILLTITAGGVGSSKIMITNTYNSDVLTINVTVLPNQEYEKKVMAAYGLNCAKSAAKYPSTLHLKNVWYKDNIKTGYGDTISRMVLETYAMNSLGGYGSIYIVVIKCGNNDHYPDAYKYNGYYINTGVHNNDPGATGYSYMLNKEAVNAYYDLFPVTSSTVLYD